MPDSGLTPLTVLIVDDLELNRRLLRERLCALSGWRLEISEAPSAEAALAAMRASPCDLLFLDHRMPGVSGLELLVQLRQLHPKTAVVMVTAGGSEKVAVEAMKKGALDYLTLEEAGRIDLGLVLRRVIEIRYLVDHNMELRQVNQMKSEFIANVSHELRTPLSVIIGYAETLKNANLGPVSEPQAKALEAIVARAEDLLRTLNQMLRTRDTGGERLILRPLELRGFLSEQAAKPNREKDRKSMALELELPDDEVWVPGDRDKLAIVVENLLANAFKFGPPASTVTLSLELREGTAQLRVRDEGPGIAQEMLSRVFERFSAAAQGPTREHGGLGLGLPLSKEIAEQHGGALWLESAERGKGTTACFAVPLAGKAHSETAAPAGKLGKRRILIVEDNPDLVDVLLLFLSSVSQNLEMTTARSGFEALDRLKEKLPDLIILDIMMPGMDGFEVIRRLRKAPETAKIPVMVLTGYAEAAKRAGAHGADEVLLKPFERHVFVSKLLQLLKKAP